jgi:uncharacterized protein YbcV (DUF1398 family)
MFTLEQVKAAHANVKSGADFPAYVQNLIRLGVKSYDIFVTDGHGEYHGEKNYSIRSAAGYTTLNIVDSSNTEAFRNKLKMHQQGKTDYATFCRDAADAGVEKWTVDMQEMTCTYYDKAGNKLVTETIPCV